MNFWYGFVRLVLYRPLPALAALFWHVTRRRVRASNRLRVASAGLPFAYELRMKWLEQVPNLAAQLQRPWTKWALQPRFSILLYAPEGCAPRRLTRSIRSIERQSYPFWTIVHAGTATIGKGISACKGDYIVPLRSGDLLSPNALFRFAEALHANPCAPLLYGDEDELDQRGRRVRPWFKPQWNAELFYADDYLSTASTIEGELARSATNGSCGSIDELMLAATSIANDKIIHIPHVLVHVDKTRERSANTRLDAVARHLARLGATCEVGPFETVKVRWPLPKHSPLVSIIVPTKDRVDLLRPCIESVVAKTDYRSFEILIIDNGSTDGQTIQFLADAQNEPNVRVVSYPGVYNFSAINNFAAVQASGSYLCLLNNDTEVVTANWLSEMMRYAVRPEIGAVGAKLLYDDGTIQHAGVVIGLGNAAGHAHRFQREKDPGYFRMAHAAHFVSAVTAACLVVEKRKFDAVGGLDAEHFPVAYNDVDFCLKIQGAGWRNVYVPHAVLLHHESKSRGKDAAPENIERYRRELQTLQERWNTKTYVDPLHNPNLDRSSETFVMRS